MCHELPIELWSIYPSYQKMISFLHRPYSGLQLVVILKYPWKYQLSLIKLWESSCVAKAENCKAFGQLLFEERWETEINGQWRQYWHLKSEGPKPGIFFGGCVFCNVVSWAEKLTAWRWDGRGLFSGVRKSRCCLIAELINPQGTSLNYEWWL